VSAFSNGGPTPEGQGGRLWGEESPRGVHRHRRSQSTSLDRGTTLRLDRTRTSSRPRSVLRSGRCAKAS
jgi:hypothetical protein